MYAVLGPPLKGYHSHKMGIKSYSYIGTRNDKVKNRYYRKVHVKDYRDLRSKVASYTYLIY